jgi:hypothetical protein
MGDDQANLLSGVFELRQWSFRGIGLRKGEDREKQTQAEKCSHDEPEATIINPTWRPSAQPSIIHSFVGLIGGRWRGFWDVCFAAFAPTFDDQV